MSVLLLVAGYLVAAPLLPFLRRILREGMYHFAALESAGALLITAGWLMRGRTLAVAINGAWLVGWTAFWLWHKVRARETAGSG